METERLGELTHMFPEAIATKPQLKHYTLEDFLAIPEGYPRYEFWDGEILEIVSPTSHHQFISANLFRLLDGYCRTHDLGVVLTAPLDVRLSPRYVFQPDLLFIAKARKAKLIGERITGAPDMVIEILSPATSARDLNQKRKIYAKHGVAEYWIVDPDDETLEVQRLQNKVLTTLGIYEKGQKLTSPTFKGLTLAIDRIFAE